MAHKKLTEKLDDITYEDLGVQFDEGFVWEKLETRLGGKKKAFPVRWLVAATVFLAMVFIPFTILENQSTTQLGVSELSKETKSRTLPNQQVAEETINSSANTLFPQSNSVQSMAVSTKSVELKEAAISIPRFTNVEFNQPKPEKIKPQFAVEDISVIQASLEDATVNDVRIKEGRKMSIRAQWHASPINEVNIENDQALKIKLYEKN